MLRFPSRGMGDGSTRPILADLHISLDLCMCIDLALRYDPFLTLRPSIPYLRTNHVVPVWLSRIHGVQANVLLWDFGKAGELPGIVAAGPTTVSFVARILSDKSWNKAGGNWFERGDGGGEDTGIDLDHRPIHRLGNHPCRIWVRQHGRYVGNANDRRDTGTIDRGVIMSGHIHKMYIINQGLTTTRCRG